jgi:sporulation-control protein
MFQKVLASFGQGGAKVDARLLDRSVRPGAPLRGEIMLTGGQVDQEVSTLAVTLLARVETLGQGTETEDLPLEKTQIGSNAVVRAGQQLTVPFELRLPWETPVTTVLGKHLTGMAVGLQTNLDLSGTVVDPQDIDAVSIEPLPAQHRVLDALSRLGFQFRNAGLEKNRIAGVDQHLPFIQEIRFAPPQTFATIFNEVAVTFLARPRDVQVVLDVDKRVRVNKGGGLGTPSRPVIGSFVVDPAAMGRMNWEQQLENWLREAAKARGIFD